MSSMASKRSAQRKKAGTRLGKVEAENRQLRAQLGETRMAVLNMRQMYRQVEQELIGAQARAANADTLTAVTLFLCGGSVVVTDEDLETLRAEYAYVDTSAGEDGTTLVRLVSREEAETAAVQGDEEAEAELDSGAE